MCILLTVFIYFTNIDFQCSKVGSMFSKKSQNFRYVSSGVYPMTECGKSGIKIVYNHNNDDYVITGVEKCNL